MELEPGEERSEVREVLSQLSGWGGGSVHIRQKKKSRVSKKSHLCYGGFNCGVDMEHRYKKVVGGGGVGI